MTSALLMLSSSDYYKQLKMADQASSTTSSPQREATPRTFRRFPNLPPEIRCEIWRHILPGPRVIHVMGSPRPNGGKCFVEGMEFPVLFRICRESRAIAAERYQLSFRPHLRYPVYFDFSCDTLLLHDDRTLHMFFERGELPLTSEVTKVKVIAVGIPSLEQVAKAHVVSGLILIMALSNALIKAASRFGNLREIVLWTTGPNAIRGFEESNFQHRIREKMRSSYSELQDPYARQRRHFLKDEDGSIPATTLMTSVDFWNRFD
jgi:2EXR family